MSTRKRFFQIMAIVLVFALLLQTLPLGGLALGAKEARAAPLPAALSQV